MHEHTQWLNASTGSCDDAHFGELYAELKKIALGRMAIERSGQALEATELVHEAWLRLQKSTPERWRDRSQFYGAAAEAMRRILVETARRRLAAKRGGGEKDLPLDGVQLPAPLADERLIGIHEVAAAGRVSRKVVPCRTWRSAFSDPRWACTMEREMDNPSPSPCPLVVTKALNKCSGSPGGSPQP